MNTNLLRSRIIHKQQKALTSDTDEGLSGIINTIIYFLAVLLGLTSILEGSVLAGIFNKSDTICPMSSG
jgi:hypothetical protein